MKRESLEDVNQCLPRQTEEGNQKNKGFVHAFQKVLPFSVHKCTPPPSVNIEDTDVIDMIKWAGPSPLFL